MQLRGTLKQMFDYALELHLVTHNPAAMVATRYIGKARKRSRVLDPLRGVYVLAEHATARKRMLQWWADYFDRIVNESNVIVGNFGNGSMA